MSMETTQSTLQGKGSLSADLHAGPAEPLEAALVRLFACETVADAWALHLQRMAGYGFDRALYSHAAMASDVGVLEDTLILSNYPHAFLDRFIRSGWWKQAVFLATAEATGAAVVPWRRHPDIQLTEEHERILAFRARHGIVAGCTISFRPLGGPGRSGTGLCAREGLCQDVVDTVWALHGQAVLAWNCAFHLRVAALPLDLPARSLTERQREALHWISDGKTVQDTAVLMGLTPATVEKHLRLARAALGVQTTTQAVLKTTLMNQMFRLPRQGTCAQHYRHDDRGCAGPASSA